MKPYKNEKEVVQMPLQFSNVEKNAFGGTVEPNVSSHLINRKDFIW